MYKNDGTGNACRNNSIPISNIPAAESRPTKLCDARSDINDVVTEVFKSKAVVVGSPTINRGILSSMASLIDMITGLKFRNKKAAAFGCYGWSGESVKILGDQLKRAGFELLDSNGLKAMWPPSEEEMTQAVAYGKEIAESGNHLNESFYFIGDTLVR